MNIQQKITEKLIELNEGIPKTMRISSPGYNTENWIKFYDNNSLKSAYLFTSIVIKMLNITISGKDKNIDLIDLPKKFGKSYEQLELKSHEEILKKIKYISSRYQIKLTKPDLPENFSQLESMIIKLVREDDFLSNWKEIVE